MLNFSAWSHIYECGAAPGMMRYLSDMNLSYTDIFHDFHHFIRQILQSILYTPEYFKKIGFQVASEVSYLPPLPSSILYKVANFTIYINLIMLFLGLSILLPLFSYKEVVRKQYLSLNLLLLVLFLSICVGSIFNLTKHWYDVDYFWILLMVVFTFFIKEHLRYLYKNKLFNIVLLYMICSSVFSLTVFLYGFSSSIKSGFAGPGISLRSYKYQKLATTLKKVENICHIDSLNSQNLILDDLTYQYFRKSKSPMLLTYISLSFLFDKATNDFLGNIQHSSGLVVRCGLLSEKELKYTVRIGSICCAPKKLVKKIIWKQFIKSN